MPPAASGIWGSRDTAAGEVEQYGDGGHASYLLRALRVPACQPLLSAYVLVGTHMSHRYDKTSTDTSGSGNVRQPDLTKGQASGPLWGQQGLGPTKSSACGSQQRQRRACWPTPVQAGALSGAVWIAYGYLECMCSVCDICYTMCNRHQPHLWLAMHANPPYCFQRL